VAVNWDAGGSEFEFLDGTGSDDFANIRIDDLRLHDGSSHYAAITAQAMASDYTLTLPAALPASAQIMTMSNTGAIAASNTISQAVTFSSAVTVSSSIVAPGYKTASASKLVLPALLFDESAESNDWSKNTGSGGYYWTIGNSSDGHTIYCGIPLNVGYQISQIDVYLQTSVARAADANSVLVSFVTHTGAATASVSSAQAANSSALQTVSITGLSTTLAAGTFYGIVVREALLGGGTLDVYGAVVHYNYP
jgi:hypothetical protein